jgi:predicted DNA-binding transcriptional regulator YafY
MDRSVSQKAHLALGYIRGLGTSESPLKTEALANLMRMSKRNVRKYIHELRVAGHPVCSDYSGSGYWMCENEEQRQAMYKQMHPHALAELQMLKTFKPKIDPNQERLGVAL